MNSKGFGELFLEELENILDIVWLSQEYKKVQNHENEKEKPQKEENRKLTEPQKSENDNEVKTQDQQIDKPPQMVEVYTTQPVFKKSSALSVDYITLPRQQTLQNYRKWEKAFKPLKITNQNRHKKVINEEKTVNLIAQTDIYQIISEYQEKPVFSLSLVIDKHYSMEIFENLIDEFCNAVAHFGIFERVENFYLDSSKSEGRFYRDRKLHQKVSKKQIVSNNNNLILVISNCISPAWKSNHIYYCIKEWSNRNFCSIVQILPRHMWLLTTLEQGVQLNWKAERAYPLNKDLYSKKSSFYFSDEQEVLKIPVVAFEPSSFHAWGNVLLAKQTYSIAGFAFLEQDLTRQPDQQETVTAEQRVENFLAQASVTGKILAAYLANLPVSYDVARYIQEVELPKSNLLHLAEVFLGDIIERIEHNGKSSFDFYDGIRDKLKYHIPPDKAWELFIKISDIVSKELGSSLNMPAFFYNPKSNKTISWSEEAIKFAELGIDILKRKGGYDYKRAEKLEKEIEKKKAILPASKRFQMGSDDGYDDEKPVHEVIINYDFEIAKYPVTFEEYDLFCEDTGREKPDDEGWGRGRRPVINVSWHDAKAYCKWLSEKTGETYRLPTEAEWEYVCRAGTTTKWSFGDDEEELEKYAWYDKNSGDKTHPAGRKLPNPWGLYDMHGNVWEWCEDWYIDNYKETTIDGSANKKGEQEYKALRGGSWISSANSSRSADRYRDYPDNRDHIFGFRLLRTLPSDNLNLINISAKDLEESDVSQPAGDVTYRCNKCHTKYALDCDELEWEEVGSHARQMGSEIHYEAYYDRECDNCGNNMGLTFNCWEYPVGAENDRDVQGNGVEEIEGDCCLDLQEQEEEQFDYDVPDDMEYEEDENESKYNESDSIEYAEEAIEEIKEWFFEHYEDPANSSLPYNSKEGGYQWIHGEPVNTAEVIYENFEKRYSEDILEKAIDEIGRHELWSPIPQSEEEFQEALGKWAKKKADDDKD